MKGEAKTAEARGDIDEQLKEQTKLFESMSMRDKLAMLQNDRSVSDIYSNLYGDMAQNKLALLRNQVREAYYSGEIKKKDFEAYDKRLQNELLQGSARAALDYANASVAPTQAALNNSLVELNRSNTVGQILDNNIKSSTKDDVVAIMKSNRVKAWYDAQPKDVQQIIMSSQAVRDAVTSLQNGRELSWSEYKALGAAMGYENAGKLVGTLIDALNLKAKGNTKVSVVKHVSSKK